MVRTSRREVLFLIAFTAAVLAANAQAVIAADAKNRPNVLIVLVDDMGYGDPGCYNHDSRIATPNIDSLAREGMRFLDAHAAGPLCHVSRYGLMTGRYPFRTNVARWPTEAVIEPARTTIASLLKEHGYRTAMVGKWHLGFDQRAYSQPWPGGPVDVGFDSFFGIRASTDIPPYFYIRDRLAVEPPTVPIEANQSEGWSPIQGRFWRRGKIAENMQLEEVLPKFTDEAISIIENHHRAASAGVTQQPLMLYLALPSPHTPWLPAPDFAGQSEVGLYGDFMQMVDAMIGRVLEALDTAGMAEETLVIFSSDNGPVWYDRDVRKWQHDSAGDLRGMKGDAWEAGHRMPFIVRWPGRVAAGSTSDQMVCFTDLLATLASIVGDELATDEGPDSFDFSPALLGRESSNPVRTSLVMESSAGLMSVREGPWKLIDGLGSGGFSRPSKVEPAPGGPRGQLYNLANDLGETQNLYDQHPEVVGRLRQILKDAQQSPSTR